MATRPFRKGYLPQWTDEVFTVSERHSRIPPVYTLKDYSGETIEGNFYHNELQKVSKIDHTYRIEKILKRRTRNGQKEYFVKWKGYPSKFNSWVNDVYKVNDLKLARS
ncbi:Heterochromatin protein 1 [Holothuria leucospilota]|uniref:Heterochromatin protein 1 n=1 Tax=Holothuria leucospilota TaxID=206669 RepID=A0A9Q0YBK3_HOLLE|nr:Heterochromatin protein 1 [Holothuria leucospilota]